MLKLYWADADRTEPIDPALFSEYRRKKLEALRLEGPRRASACAERLLMEAMRREEPERSFPLQIEADAMGKPRLSDGGPCFNLSHTGHYAACAISGEALGLDIQTLSQGSEALIRRFFTEGERELIRTAGERDAAFTRLWCRKESFLKAIGLGLRLELRSFDVSSLTAPVPYHGTAYAFREARVADLFFCVCAPEKLLSSVETLQPIRIDF